MKKYLVMCMVAAMAVTMFAGSVRACVGKTLVVGIVKDPSVSVIGEMFSILITERTGTTVVLKRFDDYDACYAAADKGDVDIIIDFTGRCYVDVLGNQPTPDADKAYEAVKDAFTKKNYVWLSPIGFMDDGSVSPSGKAMPSEAAPVVRTETLGKFPALDRVLMKLSGKVTNEAVNTLVDESGDDGTGDNKMTVKVARKFLKKNRLI